MEEKRWSLKCRSQQAPTAVKWGGICSRSVFESVMGSFPVACYGVVYYPVACCVQKEEARAGYPVACYGVVHSVTGSLGSSGNNIRTQYMELHFHVSQHIWKDCCHFPTAPSVLSAIPYAAGIFFLL